MDSNVVNLRTGMIGHLDSILSQQIVCLRGKEY